MENNEIILLIVGKSGCGKTTITEYLKKFYDMSPLYSYTTRPKREKDEVGHTFISKDEFDKLENIIAYTKYCGYEYCATVEQFNSSNLYVIDPKGIDSIFNNKYFDKLKPFKIVVLTSPWWVRFYRLIKRGDGICKTLQRLINDHKQFYSIEHRADIIINTNKSVYKIAKQINRFYIKHCMKY